jgi:outer membrane protein OmpA-like peptidoglycan-associated protein
MQRTDGRSSLYIGCIVLGVLAHIAAARAQQIEQGVAIVSEAIASRVDGFSYKPHSSSEIDFRGTALASRAEGSAKIRARSDLTEINAKFAHVPGASSFGPFAAYVLWVITPEGRANNVGAINLDSEKGSLSATTPLSSFALIVTAEPHFAVSVPSKYIVLQSVRGNVQGSSLVVTSLAARADYTMLKPLIADPKRRAPAELDMAHYAVAIAESAAAGELAPSAFLVAHEALAAAETVQGSKSSSERERVVGLARVAIQAAEDARAAADIRRQTAELDRLRQQISDRDAKIQEAAAVVEKTRLESATHEAQLQARLEQAADHLKEAERQLPSPQSRLQLAKELLSRWLVMESDDKAITAHLPSDGFTKGRAELTQDSKNRLATFAGILLGIGNLTVTVTPALQLSEDVKQLGLSQQRARALMEWLASLAIKAGVGLPADASAAVERALAPGPGVDLLIGSDESSGPGAKSAKL